MSKPKPFSILIVEPRAKLAHVYKYLPASANIIHIRSTQKAITHLNSKQKPKMVIVSASFSPSLIMNLLDALKKASKKHLISLLFMVDLANQINFVPGTHWGSKFGLICSLSSKKEVAATLERIELEDKSFGY